MNEVIQERVNQFIATRRYKEAEAALMQVLQQEPDNADALSLLGHCLSRQRRFDEAERNIRAAIGIEPANPYYLYILSIHYLEADNPPKAQRAIEDAMVIDPQNAAYFGILALIHQNNKDFQKALEYANAGLSLDPEETNCLNIRSASLFKLGKVDEAYDAVSRTLESDPENPTTHANIGWALLEQKQYKRALDHFREALRLDPNHETAKAGLVEGLKAKYLFYRLFLRYSFWMASLKQTTQWIVIIGLVFGTRILRAITSAVPALAPFTPVITFLYLAFVASTWMVDPLTNLLMRLNVYGRYALNERQLRESTIFGISISVAIVAGVTALVLPYALFIVLCIVGATLWLPLMPLAAMPVGKLRWLALGVAGVTSLLAVLALLTTFTPEPFAYVPLYIFGIAASTWATNFVRIG